MAPENAILDLVAELNRSVHKPDPEACPHAPSYIERKDCRQCTVALAEAMLQKLAAEPAPIPMILHCPECGERHIDEGEYATKVHATHACQTCGLVWRPALVPTVGVQFLPGFKNA